MLTCKTICNFADSDKTKSIQILAVIRQFVRTKQLDLRVAFELNPKLWLQRLDILQRLRIDNGREHIPSPLQGTGQWLMRHEQYKSWSEVHTTPILLLNGAPGSGKSVLVSSIRQHLVESLPKAVIACYFFNYQNTRREPLINLFRSLLHQLLSQSPQTMFGSAHEEMQQNLLYTSLQLKAERREEIPRTVWKDLFRNCVLEASSLTRVYLLIDGLDECDAEPRHWVLSQFSALASKWPKQPIRIFISSRPSASLEPFFGFRVRTIFLENENGKDVERFVHTEIGRRMPYSSRNLVVENEIVNELVKRARGVFLWVRLAIRELLLCDDTETSLESQLNMLPNDLPSYDAMLQKTASNGRTSTMLLRSILMWLSFSLRPLTVEELKDALLFDPWLDLHLGPVPGTSQSVGATNLSTLNDAWVALELYSGFVVVHESHVYLIHRTVRDFVMERSWELSVSQSESLNRCDMHGYIAIACLRSLTFHSGTNSQVGSSRWVPKSPFLEYAVEFWVEHARIVDSAGPFGVDLSPIPQLLSKDLTARRIRWESSILSCNNTSDHYRLAFFDAQASPDDSKPRGVNYTSSSSSEDNKVSGQAEWNLLHVCAASSFYHFTSAIFQSQGSSIGSGDVKDRFGRTPLSLAARYGHLSVLRLLLARGADVESRDTHYGLTPLLWACSFNHMNACSILIRAGADINDHMAASTPLVTAVATASLDLVKLLLESGADPNVVGQSFGRPALYYAVANAHVSAVKLLLDCGADVDLKDQHTNRSALYHAVSFGNLEVVRLLLDMGATSHDVESKPQTDAVPSWVDRVTFGFSRLTCEWQDHTHPSRSHACKGISQCGSGNNESMTQQTHQDSKTKSRKRRAENSAPSRQRDEENDGSEENPNKRPTLDGARQIPETAPHHRLACPYFKHSPARFSQKRPCCRREGWRNIHRLKYVLLFLR